MSECNCTRKVLDPETHEEICQDCGRTYRVVIRNEVIRHKARVLDNATTMSSRDVRGVKVSNEYSRLIFRDNITKSSRRLAEVGSLLLKIGEKMALPTIVLNGAEQLIVKCYAQDVGTYKKRRMEGLCVAALSYVSKETGIARNIREFIDIAGMRDHRRICYEMYSSLVQTFGQPKRSVSISDEYKNAVLRLCNKLELDGPIEREALKILDQVYESVGVGKKPDALATGCVYLAANHNIRQVDVGDAAGISPVSVRVNARVIQNELDRIHYGRHRVGKVQTG